MTAVQTAVHTDVASPGLFYKQIPETSFECEWLP